MRRVLAAVTALVALAFSGQTAFAAQPHQGVSSTIAAVTPAKHAPAASTPVSHSAPNPAPNPTRRRKTSTTTSVTAGAPVTLGSGTAWNWQNPLQNGNPLSSVSCPTTSVCFTVGLSGSIQKTADGGATWTAQAQQAGLNSVSCFDSTHCVAVGDFGLVMSTIDGSSWSAVITNGGNFLSGVSCPSTTTCFAVGSAGADLKSTDGGASWTAQSSGTTNNLFAIACQSPAECYAVGDKATIDYTLDGATWHLEGSGGTALFGISCLGSHPGTSCVAVGAAGTVIEATDPTCCWSPGNIGSQVDLTSVSCQATACFMTGVDGGVYARKPLDTGTHTEHTSTSELGALNGISCPSASVCFAAGDYGTIVDTTSGWTGWTQQTATPAPQAFSGVSCPSATVCFAVGNTGTIFGTTNGGTTWTAQTSNTADDFFSISCPSTSVCFAVGLGGVVDATTNGGALWTVEATLTQILQSVSCPSTTVCYAVAHSSTGLTKTTDGVNWSALAPLGTAQGPTAISCPTTMLCFATDSENTGPGNPVGSVYETVDGGASWSVSFALAGDPQAGTNGPLNAISCPDTNTCYASGGISHGVASNPATGAILATTTDGGQHWRTDNVPSLAALTGISCPTAGTCYASADDATVLHTSDFGGTWDVQFAGFAGIGYYNAVSCASSTACVVVGQAGVITATTNGGAAWSRSLPTGTTNSVVSLSCTDSSNCYGAAFDTLMSSHDGGSTWSTHTLTTTDQLASISCPAANTCFAGGWPGAIYTTADGGTTWTAQANPLAGSDNTFIGLSCATASTCVAVGTSGVVIATADGGAHWTSESSGVTADLFALSCPTASTCVAVGAAGVTLTRSGSAWTSRSSGTTQALVGVSCPSAAICYAVGHAGTLRYSSNAGVSWTARTSGTTENLHGISCLSATSCVADGASGTVVSTSNGTAWTSVPAPTVNALEGVADVDSAHIWISGAGGTILQAAMPCTKPTLGTDLASPQIGGTPIQLTASTTCGVPPPLFQFWVRTPDLKWHVIQDYSTSNTASWNTFDTTTGSYMLEVDVKNSGSLGAYDSFTDIPYTLTLCDGPLLSTGAATSPYASGAGAITLTGSGSCVGTTEFSFWWRDTSRIWHLLRDYSTNPSTTWNADYRAGNYLLEVDIRPVGSSAVYITFLDVPFTLSGCGAPTLIPDRTSPQVAGTTITWTANTTCSGTPQYQFWVRSAAGVWAPTGPYGAGNTFAWNSPATTGGYVVEVDVRNAGATQDAYDSFIDVPYTLSLCGLPMLSTGAATSPYVSGSGPITLTGSGTCAGGTQFEFYYHDIFGWHLLRGYSTNPSTTWNADYKAGNYLLEVDLRPVGSSAGYITYLDVPFTLSGCSAPTLSPDKTSPQIAGTTVNWTASTTCSGTPQYQFWVRSAAGVWAPTGPYGAGNTFAWHSPATTGGYVVEVDVRNLGANQDAYDSFIDVPYTLSLCGLPTLSTGAATSPYASGSGAITLTGSGSCAGTTQFSFWWRDTSHTWHLLRDFSTNPSTTWNADYKAGDYLLEVDLRPAGSSAVYVTYLDVPFTLSGCSAPTLVPDKPSPQHVGTGSTTVTWTANTTCSGTPEYEFWVRNPVGVWAVVQPYGAGNTFTWHPTAGGYIVEVDVRNHGANQDAYDNYTDIPYNLVP